MTSDLSVAVELHASDAVHVSVLQHREGLQGERVPDADVRVIPDLSGGHLGLVAADSKTEYIN